MQLREEIRAICDDLYQITGIKAVVYDADMRILYSHPATMGPFCAALRRIPGISEKCLACDRSGLERCRRDRDICVYRCHMGLTEATAPILADGAAIGYLMFGQLLARDSRAEVLRRLDALKGLEEKAALREEIIRMEETDEHTLRAAARLLSMCACYIRLHPLLRTQRQSQALPMAQYIEENLADPGLSIARLCAVFGVSRGTLYQRSRAAFQMGITDYIRQARVNAALALLRQTDLPLYAVAAQVGICDPDYLARLIKRQTGKSPRRLRQESDAPQEK